MAGRLVVVSNRVSVPGARGVAAGGLAVPLSPLHTRPELEQLLSDAGPVRVLCDPQLYGHLPSVLPCIW